MPPPPRQLLIESFWAAVDAVSPARCLPAHLPPPPRGRTLVLGAGKAAAAMAATVEAHWPADAPLGGLVITRHGHACPTQRIRVVEAGHPLPDQAGRRAARRLLALAGQAGPDDLVLALISGGGSSLLGLPAPGLDLPALRRVTGDLLRCGAPIQDINVVRKHLSATLGGRLAAACAAPALSLIISDVTGNDPSLIASGPFAPDPSRYGDALALLRRWSVMAPARVTRHLEAGAAGLIAETPKPGDPCFARVENRVIASGHAALEGAAAYFRAQGVEPVLLGDRFGGGARLLAARFARRCREVRRGLRAGEPPRVLLSGGETTVTVRGAGLGGRNGEFLLALALGLKGMDGVHALAADTDGIDGAGDNAGALIDPTTLERARRAGLDPREHLADNDTHGFFAALGDLLVTGPTRTNANDYRAILLA